MPPTAAASSRQPFGEHGNSMLQQNGRSKSSGRTGLFMDLSQQQRALQQAMHDRRSQSRPSVRSEQQYESERQRYQRPRPISTGRTLRQATSHESEEDQQDPAAVTRAILDLREKREQAHRHRESMKQHSRSSSGSVHDNTPASPQQVASNNRLKHAEDKITNLMQELEELRFFHEIDITTPAMPQSSPVANQVRSAPPQAQAPPSRRNIPAPTTTRTSSPLRRNPPVASIRSSQQQLPQRSPPITSNQPSRTSPTLREASPLRRPAPSSLDPRPALSPRRIAALDRTTLELETQELQRRVDILQRETLTLNATLELLEHELDGKEDDVRRIHILEDALAEVRKELSTQLQEMNHGRAQLSDQYEAKLEQMRNKYEQSKQESKDLATQLSTLKQGMEELESCYKVKDEQAKLTLQQRQVAADERESLLELQLAEANLQLDNVKESLQDQAKLVSKVEKEVLATTERLEFELKEQKEQFSAKLQILENQLEGSQLVVDRMKVEHQTQQQLLEQRNEELATARATNMSQATKQEQLEERMEDMAAQHKIDLETLKKTHEDRERQRLDSIVQTNHTATKEMEIRMADLQMQLKLANDRHEMEMQAKDDDMNRRLERELKEATLAAAVNGSVELAKVQEELEVITKQYEQAKEESMLVQVQAESKDRNMAREWERKDSMRQGEMDRMNDKLDKAMRDVSERDSKIQTLLDRLSNTENSKKFSLLELEAQHDEVVKAREELLENQRKVWKSSEAKLRIELARKESEILELQESTNIETEKLQKEIEQLRKQVNDKDRCRDVVDLELNTKISQMQAYIEKAQQDFVSEQARHEALESELRVEIAKIDGKLSATESTLKEKRLLIEDLEEKLTHADDAVSTANNKLHAEIFALRRDLEASRELLLQERTVADEKERQLSELTQEQQADKVKLEQLSELQEKLAALQETVESTHQEKSVHLEELNKLQKEQEEAAERLEETKKKLAVEKEQVSMELMRKQKEIETTIEQFTFTIVDMEKKLGEKDAELSSLKNEVEKLKGSLLRAADASVARSMDTKEMQDKIRELEMAIETYKESSIKLKSEKAEQIADLEKKFNDAKIVQEEIVKQMDVIVHERAEAFEALEQVIQEVHIREDELDSLSTVLEKRDNELENAKIIATKALASAQEIKMKYVQKGVRQSDRYTELQIQIDELHASMEFLHNKNDKMKVKTMRLETELRDKNSECIRLRDVLRDVTRQDEHHESRAVASEFSTVDQHGFLPLEVPEPNSPIHIGKMDEFMSMESSFTMMQADEPSQASSFIINEAMSTNTAELGGATQWLQDFNGDNISNFGESVNGVRSEPGAQGIARRALERDSLRKYVRRRYLKHKEKLGTESRSEC